MFLSESVAPANLSEAVGEVEGTPEGILHIVLESECEYANLRESMFRLEHSAIVSENTELLSEGVKDYWNRLVAFLKRLWNSIVLWFNDLFNRLKVIFTNISKFLANNKKYLDAANLNGAKMKLARGLTIENIQGVYERMKKGAEDLGNTSSGSPLGMREFKARIARNNGGSQGENFGVAVAREMRGGKGEEAEELTAADVAQAVKNLEGFNAAVTGIKNGKTAADQALKTAISEAQKAAAESAKTDSNNAQDAASALRTKIDNMKTSGQVQAMLAGAATSALNAMAAQSIAVCKAAIRGGRKQEGEDKKAAAKAKKEEGKQSADGVLASFGYEG